MTELPLTGVRVLELAEGRSGLCGRYLADLGANVTLLEPPQGAPARHFEPHFGETSLYFLTHHANKQSLCVDIDSKEGRAQLKALLNDVDIFIVDAKPGRQDELGLEAEQLLADYPALVTLAISDFGQTGSYRDFAATNAVLMALTGQLARSGIKDREPLLPPGELAYETTSIQAAWCALLAYWQRLRTGRGDFLDFSTFEATAQILDPALGATGSAAAGKSAAELAPRGRPPRGKLYPIFPCADGCVRICILNPRQWQGMSEWLGTDHPFTDPGWGSLGKRLSAIREINALIEALFSDKTQEALVMEGQRRGVPIAALATPAGVLANAHFKARDAFIDISVGNARGRMINGMVEIDGERLGIRTPAPAIGSAVHNPRTSPEIPSPAKTERPLAGIRVLDLGIIVAGAELGRLLADQGADVVKVENRVFPDGLRQSRTNEPITESFAQGNRGKRSLGLNLRCEEGIAVFKRLVAVADIVLSNFKPGTMESLGLGYEVLREINPGIIVSDSSALGATGPLAKSMGYGPLVRASTGLTRLWRYPDQDDGYADSITIFPDHFAARISATAILSLLVRRQHTGLGGTVSLSQAESILTVMADTLLLESLQPGSLVAQGNRGRHYAPDNVFPCSGDDEWCVIATRDDHEFRVLCSIMDSPELANDERFTTTEDRLAHVAELETLVSEWTQKHDPDAVMSLLQSKGIPAARMVRLSELNEDPHLQVRRYFRKLQQPGLPQRLLTENGPCAATHLPDPDICPAPFMAEHTGIICRVWLGMQEPEYRKLLELGVLEENAKAEIMAMSLK